MSHCEPDIWTKRYRAALEPGVIKQRAETRGKIVQSLNGSEIEVACRRLQLGLQEVNLITEQAESIIRVVVERALAHPELVYCDPHAVLRAAYEGSRSEDVYVPILITGQAGVGKTRIRQSIQRVLSGREFVWVDESHPRMPLIDYAECVIAQQSSVLEVLRPLANPEIASGSVKVKRGEIAGKCARWQRVCGTCLLGVDELQFMGQSETANTLVTRTLLAFADVGLPWFAIANYSLIWKLLDRPSEAMQRLLSHPVIVLPDPPSSVDWAALLMEFQVVLEEALEFKLIDLRLDIWNLCAGLKRELVNLLVHAYRIARRSGASKANWLDVQQAFKSVEFAASRRDINLLIAHAGQGGELRRDLKCPLEGPGLVSRSVAYLDQLRAARTKAVARANIEAAMTAEERSAIDGIKQAGQPVARPPAKVVSMSKSKPRTLDQLLKAGRDMREALGREPQG